ncbi:glycoside hydrolase domain-containing protein [Sinanaerobacter chloroacetimidivorans]|uniref:glycoside hydrolase domain-containing protein n=1 Tax=Sinanaerobacter chloroacetimidivorans TaxID=2818044 RepID=UPI001D05C1AA|nr:glycoside hydrolase domain-containing protein [Sinanaerobacter chloroacetimidivorans]
MLELAIYEWGVDSAENVTEDLFQCVLCNFGYPKFWGRYLVRVPGVSEGLTKQEITLIRSKGIKLLPIYNFFQEAIGYMQGREAANLAVFHARNLGIPKGTPLFANIERFFQIDHEWIQGWTEAILTSGYKSGIYNDPVTGGFSKAFCNAAKENKKIKMLNILWSAEPELEPSGPWNPPNYRPLAPHCGGRVWAWQYSRKVTQCSIDTNLANSSLVNILW